MAALWVAQRDVHPVYKQDHQPAGGVDCHADTWALHILNEACTLTSTGARHAVTAACKPLNAAVASHMLVMRCIPCQLCRFVEICSPGIPLFLLQAALQERQQEGGRRAALWPGPAC